MLIPLMGKGRHTRGRLVPTTSPLKSLLKGTGHRDLFHEHFTMSFLRKKSQGLAQKIQTGLNLLNY